MEEGSIKMRSGVAVRSPADQSEHLVTPMCRKEEFFPRSVRRYCGRDPPVRGEATEPTRTKKDFNHKMETLR
ncbi:hypothetical protein TNCV_454771 [Trichonephila clavipes]|nr:hypothetical protein TNCV_454771 [Trichonephila clavipes]